MMAEGHHFHPLVELQRIQVDATVVGHAIPSQRRTSALGQLLPRNQVRVVLQLGGDDDVTGADGMFEPLVPQHVGDEVERLGGVLGEHQLVGLRTDERRDVGTALLVSVGGLFHQLVRTTVHRAVGRGQELPFGVEHLQWLLRGRPGIQVGQLLSATHHPAQNREISSDPGQVHRLCRSGHIRLRPPA